MREIERAYLTLGLKKGSSLRQVDEACQDLRALWNPDRLSHNPRLRAKAGEKIREIDAAYEILIEHLGHARKLKTNPTPASKEASASKRPGTGEQPAASLFEEAFSESLSGAGKRIPVWGIVIVAIFAILFLSYLAFAPNQEETSKFKEIAPEEEESELTKLVEEIRTRYSEGEDAVPESSPESGSVSEETGQHSPAQSERAQVLPLSRQPEKTAPTPAVPKVEKPVAVRPEPVRETQPAPVPEVERQEVRPENKPRLVREEVVPDKPVERETGPSEEQLNIFKTLLQGSDTASKLVKGEIETLDFTEWSVIQETPSETWVDVVATWSSGQEVHFFWGVNPSTGGVRALNQAARNLETSMGGP